MRLERAVFDFAGDLKVENVVFEHAAADLFGESQLNADQFSVALSNHAERPGEVLERFEIAGNLVGFWRVDHAWVFHA